MSRAKCPTLDNSLSLLNDLLTSRGMAHDPTVWYHITRLLSERIVQNRAPQTEQEYCHLLGPLVCKSERHQQHLPAVIHQWFEMQPIQSAKIANVSVQSSLPQSVSSETTHQLHDRLKKIKRRHLGLVLVVICSLSLGLYRFYDQLTIIPPVTDKEIVTDQGPNLDQEKGTTKTNIPIVDQVSPNPVPIPPLSFDDRRIYWGVVAAFPLALLLLWLSWRYRAQAALNPLPQSRDDNLNGLKIIDHPLPADMPFSGDTLALELAPLGRSHYQLTRREDIPASVSASVKQFGLPSFRFRRKSARPKYLVLLQSLHNNDQIHALANLFINSLKSQSLDLRGYRFREDPRKLHALANLQPSDEPHQGYMRLEQLAEQYPEARLLVVADWQILFDPIYQHTLETWREAFKPWSKRVWLSPGYATQQQTEQAQHQAEQLNMRLLRLDSANAEHIAHWLTQEQPEWLENQGGLEAYPPSLTASGESWLHPRPPHGVSVKQMLRELKAYLGDAGYIVLQALAVYPKPQWPLPYVLDQRLNSNPEDQAGREQRLLRIARLPWCREAHLPDYLRLLLLKALTPKQRRKISQAWHQIIDEAQVSPDFDLPIAKPDQRALKREMFLRSQRMGSHFDDAIFANIYRGGKLGLLDFKIPYKLAKLLPAARWLDLRPAVQGLLTALVFAGIAHMGWQTLWEPMFSESLQVWINRDHSDWSVTITHDDTTRALADTLKQKLAGNGFIDITLQGKPAQGEHRDDNYIKFAAGGADIAEHVRQPLAWLSYQSPATPLPDLSLQPKQIRIELNRTYQAGTSFHDPIEDLTALLKLKRRLDKFGQIQMMLSTISAWFDRATLKPYEPETVIIPAGSFLMGSPASEAERSEDEGPQHEVTFAKPFAIGKTEVTFDQYDAFADATGRKKPDDPGWGRGNRPVINVSYADAQAYVQWLSQQTGKHYRLPTEAEWEYAARAGTSTPFYTGNCISTEQANYDGNYDYNSCGAKSSVYLAKSQEVGNYPANAWGLHDTAGNVLEWTADCWHGNYQNAPQDGSQAWQDANQGDCGTRVVRGGSWNGSPGYLRSAFRYRSNTDEANDNLGFRIARAW